MDKNKIDCTFSPTSVNNWVEDTSVWIPFLDWTIEVSVSEKGEDEVNYIRIHVLSDTNSLIDCTEDFFQHHTDSQDIIKPTGSNLYQVFDVLRTVYKLKSKKGEIVNG